MMWRYTAHDGTTCRIEIPPLPGEKFAAHLARSCAAVRDALGIKPAAADDPARWAEIKAAVSGK